MQRYYHQNPNALEEHRQFEISTKEFISKRQTAQPYIIPVVVHVYGKIFSGTKVDETIIKTAIDKVNEDFQGRNDDFNTVNSAFKEIKSAFSVTFKLATLDPDGKSTTGIVWYDEPRYGYATGMFEDWIQYDAWDNYKYCNVYIQSDIYGNGDLTQSGVAWFPDSFMSDKNLARIVYNGRHLYGNTNKEFASMLTHEFGHWLNLFHTFEAGCMESSEGPCDKTGDRVCDTPQTISKDGCEPVYNCAGKLENSENYMSYTGADGCYKMFTVGQVARMDAAMQHPARKSLWQLENLKATGLL
ncbi:unnamed protein product [Rotaria sordida]|uniref:Peptidase M43 pregnancy-associated plasma-A domain-containing protein n=1 Tax=Rotaria sordida TaxID=392033 RepID=A0A814YJV8_9BILA|nr:unnamed protein product [Rotaria sordida]CAF1512084.1 unnamed protein product [Rotaria sordida]